MTKRQIFTKEFKLEAVRLLNEGRKPGADPARELNGVSTEWHLLKGMSPYFSSFRPWPSPGQAAAGIQETADP